jgi:SAM-dependent methyltransferase
MMAKESWSQLPHLMYAWKTAYVIKGLLTWVPGLYAWRLQRASTGGTNSPRYCYSVWLRHLVMLSQQGFRIRDAVVGEFGPGDSIGCGLASLLSGAQRYVGLDIVPFAANTEVKEVFRDLVRLFTDKEPIPDHREFPFARPLLQTYDFPVSLVDTTDFAERVEKIAQDLKTGVTSGQYVQYLAPWTTMSKGIAEGSLDLIFSQAVLEHAESLEDVYRTMCLLLKPGGYASHVIDFGCHHVAPLWNGHWAYADWEWKLVRGNRDFFLNRQPLSAHLAYAKNAGFDVLAVEQERNTQGLAVQVLTRYTSAVTADDAQTRGAMVLLRKPGHMKTLASTAVNSAV